MNTYETFTDLQKKYPERPSGSPGVSAILEEIKKQASIWGGAAKIEKIPVYRFQTSLLVFIFGSLVVTFISLVSQVAGFIIEALLALLLIREFIHPVLSRVKTGQGENLTVTIPARGKEFQKIFLITNVSTDNFIDRPERFSTGLYLGLVFLLGLAVVLLQALNLLLKVDSLFLLPLLPLLGLLYFVLPGKSPSLSETGLANCAVLLELGAILTKMTPFTTSVTMVFSGSRSLNSGVQGMSKLFKGCPELTYVIDLLETPNKQIEIVTQDGAIFPKPGDSLLVGMLMEVAREKEIPVQMVKMEEVTGSYPFKFKKLAAISIGTPKANSEKELRELLVGVVRKLDQ